MNDTAIRLKKIAFTALFSALIAVGAFLRIPVPMVPFTLQFMFANLAVLVLGKKYGALAVVVYVALGLIGVPIFTQGGGFYYVLKPTFGYLIGFALGNFVAGAVLEHMDRTKPKTLIIAGFVNMSVVYVIGTVYFYFIAKFYLNAEYTLWALLVTCCFKTLWSDTIFVFVTAFFAIKLNKILHLGFEQDNELRKLKSVYLKIKKDGVADEKDIALLLSAPINPFAKYANKLRKRFCGNRFDLCGIINAKSGNCTEDCKFCAQSTRGTPSAKSYELLPGEELAKLLKNLSADGVCRVSAVLSGKRPTGEEVQKLCDAFGDLKNDGIQTCVSAGLLSKEDLLKLKESGVKRIHNNLESSARYFPEICTTHTYQEKLDTIREALGIGFTVCSGGLFGLGETWEDRVFLALTLKKLQITSVPINFYLTTTADENFVPLNDTEKRRIVALFRFLLPTAEIRIAGGRAQLSDFGKKLFLGGANAAIGGDMLTTAGIDVADDLKMISSLGYKIATNCNKIF